MSQASRDQYLESKILTASQPQLHLMLLDGAIRFGRQAQAIWTDKADFADVDLLLAKMSDIVDELTHGAMAGTQTLSKQFEEQYAFVYRELISSRFNEDAEKLASCIDLLAYQQETWKMACEKLESEKATSKVKPGLPHMRPAMEMPMQGMSLEA
jgi:flagellar protein FliS